MQYKIVVTNRIGRVIFEGRISSLQQAINEVQQWLLEGNVVTIEALYI